jgi:hypothetical protein
MPRLLLVAAIAGFFALVYWLVWTHSKVSAGRIGRQSPD